MINSLTGKMSGQRGNVLFLENNGVEWSLQVSLQTIQEVGASSDRLRLFTYLHHREDQMQLFGFSSEQERDIFLELIRISGIGPKQALKIL
ncbi:MAG TPA: Holliday junction branch migration protein RuvA, partial [Sediminispirochaeta sp.]|nr:Holliday junction branch migration protein RuvA [Sediminispirochaeta sp.]